MNMRWAVWMLVGTELCVTAGASAESKSTKWQTYRSPDYGFTIEYPQSMTMYPDRPVKAPERSMFPVCEWTLACFQYNGDAFHNTNVQSMGVSVNVLREMKTEGECNQIDTGTRAVKIMTINGILFHYGDTDEAGLGSGRSVTQYRAFHQNVCFEVALVTA